MELSYLNNSATVKVSTDMNKVETREISIMTVKAEEFPLNIVL